MRKWWLVIYNEIAKSYVHVHLPIPIGITNVQWIYWKIMTPSIYIFQFLIQYFYCIALFFFNLQSPILCLNIFHHFRIPSPILIHFANCHYYFGKSNLLHLHLSSFIWSSIIKTCLKTILRKFNRVGIHLKLD